MIDKPLKVRAQQKPFRKGVSFQLEQDELFAHNIEFKSVEVGYIPPEAFAMRNEDAQILMDDLWAAGLRPMEGSGSAGALLATQGHLLDMRKIAFHKLNIPND